MVGCGGSDILVPLVGGLEINTASSGAQMDSDGYEVTIDAGTASAIGPNATLRRDDLEPGIHSVQLGGVADHCSVGADNPRTVSITAGQTTSITFSVTCIAPTGSLEITTATSGDATDLDGYDVTIDAGAASAIGANATLRRDDLEPGIHSVQLGGVADRCSLGADNPRAVSVTAGQTTSITFSVTCIAPTGSLEITTATSGDATDLDGYDVTIDAGTAFAIGANATLRRDDLEPGNYNVQLGGMADHCSVGADNPRSASVTAGQTTTLTFILTCTAPVPPAPGTRVDLGTRRGHIWGWSNAGLFVGSVGGEDGGQSRAAIWQYHALLDISRPEWGMSEAHDANDAGQVVGEYTSFTGTAFLWENGVVTDLGTHGEAGWSTASAINNAGVVAGTSSVCTSCGRATIWDHGQIIDVGTLPPPWDQGSKALGINDRGEVIGMSGGEVAGHQIRHAFIWRDGVMVDLGILRPGDDVITPLAINNRGQIIGNSSNSETYRPFIWENGVMRELVDPQGRRFLPSRLNDDGIVYGTDLDGDRALWQDGRVLKLPAHPGSGGWEDNSLGEVLGSSDDQPAVWIIDRATVVHHVP